MEGGGKGLSLVALEPPSEITFNGPFTDVVTSYLRIRNPHSKTVCFKVKTTAPKQYCVRPNSGVVKPGEVATVAVMLQPIDSIPADASKHKFMVQSCYTPADGTDLDVFWKNVNPAELHYGKLRVLFEPAKGGVQKASPSVGDDAGAAGDFVSPASYIRAEAASPSSTTFSSPSGDDRTRKLEQEVDRLTRERADLLLKVQAANARAAQAGGEFNLPMVQILLIVLAGLLVGLIFGKLF